MTRRPDFIIIGAMKSATSTLHAQLAGQPGVFMSTPKEPNFFSDDDQWSRGLEWYESLFASAPSGALCGESSTHYTKLPTYPDAIRRMRQSLGLDVKLICVMRHPIDRLVSHYIHEWTQRVMSCPIDDAIDRHPELIAYSQYAMQLEPYVEAFGEWNILPVFFDRLSNSPQSELERVCRFIGYAGSPHWNDELREQNVSRERLRQSAMRDAIVEMPGLKQLRRAVVPKAAREWVKGFWRMKDRPQLSSANLRRLSDVFDRDLARIGAWLGLDLRCDNFKSLTAEIVPCWRTALKASAA